MKASIKLIPTSPATLQFPVMARCRDNGAIVLFRDEVHGTVLSAGTGNCYQIGHHGMFIKITDTNVWEIVSTGSSVTLTQESIWA